MDPPKMAAAPAIPVAFGRESQFVTCPHCHNQVQSEVTSESTTKTHMIALIMCCCLCWPCAWVPYCMDSCKDQHHKCPNCHALLGIHNN